MTRLLLIPLISALVLQPVSPPELTPRFDQPSVAIINPEFRLPQNADSVVYVRQQPHGDNAGGCTSFAVRIAKQNIYITAQHCVSNPPISINKQPGTVILADKDVDIAALSVPVQPKGVLSIGPEPAHTEQCVGIGFVGGTPTFIVTRKAAQENTKVVWLPKFLPGMSGGPILNHRGEVVGIIQNVGNPTSVFDIVAVSSSSGELKAFLKRVEIALKG